jgi:glycolate oxidase
VTDAMLAELRSHLPADAVVTDRDIVEAYRRDQTSWSEPGTPLAVVLPRTTDEVAAILRAASAHRAPVVPRGAGSGLSGGASAVDGCVVLSLTRMNAVLDVDAAEQLIVVQPGVLTADVAAAAASAGLWYPPDPASIEFCSIGGNVATNAGGLCCVKYGVTADYVLGLQVVLADGRVVRTGRRTVKGVAGYDLTRLLVGSEGTLGVVTEITLRLRSPRAAATTLVASFGTLSGAGEAVVAAVSGAPPALLEIMDRTTVRAVDDWRHLALDRDAACLLFAQSDLGGAAGAEEITRLAAVCEGAGADLVLTTDDPAEGTEILGARRLAYPALERLGATLLDDVAVPRTRIPALIAAVERVAAESGLVIGTFGHAGDGNLHPTVVHDGLDPESVARAGRAFDDIVSVTLELGGTVTGEHGVGRLKRSWLARELDPVALDLHRSVKTAFDPLGILNPGAVL